MENRKMLLVIFTLCGYCQSASKTQAADTADQYTWRISSQLQNPLIDASISDERLNFTIDTRTTSSSSLFILYGCHLNLMCTADYPVIWINAMGEAISDQVTRNPTNMKAPGDKYGQSILPVEDRFRSNVSIAVVTEGFILECGNPSLWDRTPIRVNISVFTLHAAKSHIRLIGFERMALATETCFRGFYPMFIVPMCYPIYAAVAFLYSAPQSVETKFFVYERETLASSLNESDSEADTTISFNRELADDFHLIVLSCVHVARKRQDFTLVVEKRFDNESTLRQSVKYGLEDVTHASFSDMKNVRLDVDDPYGVKSVKFGVLPVLELNKTYNIQLFLPKEEDIGPRYDYKSFNYTTEVLVKPVIPFRIPYRSCQTFEDTNENGAENCGILSVNSPHPEGDDQKLLEINIQARNPCILSIFVSRSDQFSYTPWYDTYFQPSPYYISSMIRIAVLDTRIMSAKQTNEPLVLPASQGVVSGFELIAGDTFTLRCLIPACQFNVGLQWCTMSGQGDDTQVDLDSCVKFMVLTSSYDVIFGDNNPNITFSIDYVNEFTLAFDQTFLSLTINDSGLHRCLFNRYEEYPSPLSSDSTFDIVVHNPMKPTFPNNISVKSTSTIQRGDLLTLDCSVEAHPAASLSWTQNGKPIDNYRTDRFPKIASNENVSLVINEPGEYACRATNRFGLSERSFKVYPLDTWTLVLETILPLIIGFAVLAAIMAFVIRRRMLKMVLRRLAKNLLNTDGLVDENGYLNDQTKQLTYDQSIYELDRDSFELECLLGKGEFGHVYKGQVHFPNKTARAIAIKVPADSNNPKHFTMLVSELKLMARLKPHVNVLGLIGACTKYLESKAFYLLTEFCEYGSLLDYMVLHRKDFENPSIQTTMEFCYETLLSYAYQAASGMEQLASQRVIHRDIALRNLLLTKNHVVKVSDFGLSRLAPSIYKKDFSKCDKMPLYWMALESITVGEYTEKSDVWSFGILFWELFSCGRQPFPDYQIDRKRETQMYLEWLHNGERLAPTRLSQKQENCLMRRCWDSDPSRRPGFAQCKLALNDRMNSSTLENLHVRLADAWSAQCQIFQTRGHTAPQCSQQSNNQSAFAAEAVVAATLDRGRDHEHNNSSKEAAGSLQNRVTSESGIERHRRSWDIDMDSMDATSSGDRASTDDRSSDDTGQVKRSNNTQAAAADVSEEPTTIIDVSCFHYSSPN